MLQFRMGQIGNRYGTVFPDMPVSQVFRLKGFFQGYFFIQVNRHQALVHVESYIIGTKQFEERVGKDVLSAMLLHVVQPVRPVHLHRNLAAHRKLSCALMDNFFLRFPHMLHRSSINRTRVTELSAPFREQHRPVQHYRKPLGRLFAFQHRRFAGF